MANNTYKKQVPQIGFRTGPIGVDLTKGVNHMWITGRLTAQIDIAAGGGNDGVVNPEGVQRFLRSARIVHSVFKDIVPRVSGRDLFRLLAVSRAQITAAANLAAPGVQAATLVSFDFIVPFAQPWMQQPILSCFPRQATSAGDTFALEVQFEDAIVTGGDSPGSAAFITGGDRAITISNVALQLQEVYTLVPIMPYGLGAIELVESEQVVAANANLQLPLRELNPFTMSILRYLEGPQANPAARITDWRFSTGQEDVYDRLITVMSQREQAGLFPALLTAGQVGTLQERWGDGAFGQALDPAGYGKPQFIFNTTIPGTNPGAIRGLFAGIIERDGVTRRRV